MPGQNRFGFFSQGDFRKVCNGLIQQMGGGFGALFNSRVFATVDASLFVPGRRPGFRHNFLVFKKASWGMMPPPVKSIKRA